MDGFAESLLSFGYSTTMNRYSYSSDYVKPFIHFRPQIGQMWKWKGDKTVPHVDRLKIHEKTFHLDNDWIVSDAWHDNNPAYHIPEAELLEKYELE